MNNYPSWWDTDITVYNKLVDANHQVTWQSTHLTNCFWQYVENKVTIGETILKTNGTICRIPKNDAFKERAEWVQLSPTERANFFTLSPEDIIVRGNVTDTIDEYTSGSRSSDLLKKYKSLQGCMVIDQCSVNTGIGRGNEHYYIRGV